MNELHSRYSDKGLVILGVPCNQFGHQVGHPLIQRWLTYCELVICLQYGDINCGMAYFIMSLGYRAFVGVWRKLYFLLLLPVT